MSDNEVMFLFFMLALITYLVVCVVSHNKRLERLEEKYRPRERRQTIAKMLAAGMITPNNASEMLFNPKCTCEDLTTPAYPEFAAVMFDPNCPFHGDLEDKSLDGGQ